MRAGDTIIEALRPENRIYGAVKAVKRLKVVKMSCLIVGKKELRTYEKT